MMCRGGQAQDTRALPGTVYQTLLLRYLKVRPGHLDLGVEERHSALD